MAENVIYTSLDLTTVDLFNPLPGFFKHAHRQKVSQTETLKLDLSVKAQRLVL